MDLSQLGFVLDEFLNENVPKPLKKEDRIVPENMVDNIPTDIEAISVEEDEDDIERALDGYEYLSTFNAPQREQWDCESILSKRVYTFNNNILYL